MLIFFKIKDTRISLFLDEYYTSKQISLGITSYQTLQYWDPETKKKKKKWIYTSLKKYTYKFLFNYIFDYRGLALVFLLLIL